VTFPASSLSRPGKGTHKVLFGRVKETTFFLRENRSPEALQTCPAIGLSNFYCWKTKAVFKYVRKYFCLRFIVCRCSAEFLGSKNKNEIIFWASKLKSESAPARSGGYHQNSLDKSHKTRLKRRFDFERKSYLHTDFFHYFWIYWKHQNAKIDQNAFVDGSIIRPLSFFAFWCRKPIFFGECNGKNRTNLRFTLVYCIFTLKSA